MFSTLLAMLPSYAFADANGAVQFVSPCETTVSGEVLVKATGFILNPLEDLPREYRLHVFSDSACGLDCEMVREPLLLAPGETVQWEITCSYDSTLTDNGQHISHGTLSERPQTIPPPPPYVLLDELGCPYTVSN